MVTISSEMFRYTVLPCASCDERFYLVTGLTVRKRRTWPLCLPAYSSVRRHLKCEALEKKSVSMEILERIASGEILPQEAEKMLKENSSSSELELDNFARLDLGRVDRTGFPEVVWGPGKTPEQIASIMAALSSHQAIAMATRIPQDVFEKVQELLPGAKYHKMGRIMTYSSGSNGHSVSPLPGLVAILSAGTSDLPVSEESRLTAELMGCTVLQLTDVGVAGLHRLIKQLPKVRTATVVIVVAGMDGALPSVVAGLVDAPVIAVPTSVGYGAAFQGVAPLLSNLNSCAPGVVVVNIDNGFGAAMAAARMLRMISTKSMGTGS